MQSQGQSLKKPPSKNAKEGKTQNLDYVYYLNDTFLPSMNNESDQQTYRVYLPEQQDIDQNQDKGLNEWRFHGLNKQDFSTKTLILEQQKDSTLSSFFQKVVLED